MKRENVRDRAAQIYAAIVADWSIEATLERSLEMAVDAAILFESRVDAEIEAKMVGMDTENEALKEITLSIKLPAKIRAKQARTYYCGKNFFPVTFTERFVAYVRQINFQYKTMLVDFGTEKDWFHIDMIKKDFELCESQS